MSFSSVIIYNFNVEIFMQSGLKVVWWWFCKRKVLNECPLCEEELVLNVQILCSCQKQSLSKGAEKKNCLLKQICSVAKARISACQLEKITGTGQSKWRWNLNFIHKHLITFCSATAPLKLPSPVKTITILTHYFIFNQCKSWFFFDFCQKWICTSAGLVWMELFLDLCLATWVCEQLGRPWTIPQGAEDGWVSTRNLVKTRQDCLPQPFRQLI